MAHCLQAYAQCRCELRPCRIAGASRFSELGSKCVNTVRAHAYILPAKCADSIPSRLGVGSKKTFPHCLQEYGCSCCSLCVQIVTQSLWRVGTLEYIRPVKYAEKIPSRLGVLGKKLNFLHPLRIHLGKRRRGKAGTSHSNRLRGKCMHNVRTLEYILTAKRAD